MNQEWNDQFYGCHPNVDVDSGSKWAYNTSFFIILLKLMDNVTPILGHFWECLKKRCIVAPNKREERVGR